jgi:protein-S-isoprenylcysteine O-methyltransferase Ste14
MTTQKAPSFFAHLGAILALPFMVLIVIPCTIYFSSNGEPLFSWLSEYRMVFRIAGILFLIVGFILFITTLSFFHRIGKGTLAPWNPPKSLVVTGPYRYVRNPMISAVNAILLAEAFLLPSGYILIWQLFFFAMNHVVFISKEEPDLVKRFGEEYEEYMGEVGRWIPRWRGRGK